MRGSVSGTVIVSNWQMEGVVIVVPECSQGYDMEGTERNTLVGYEGKSCEKQTWMSAQQHSPWLQLQQWTGILCPWPPGVCELREEEQGKRDEIYIRALLNVSNQESQ